MTEFSFVVTVEVLLQLDATLIQTSLDAVHLISPLNLRGLNVHLISSSVMNVFDLKVLFMTDSIYLLLITNFLKPPLGKKKCQSHSQLYRFLGNYIYLQASSSVIALLNWLISIRLTV